MHESSCWHSSTSFSFLYNFFCTKTNACFNILNGTIRNQQLVTFFGEMIKSRFSISKTEFTPAPPPCFPLPTKTYFFLLPICTESIGFQKFLNKNKIENWRKLGKITLRVDLCSCMHEFKRTKKTLKNSNSIP